MKFVCRKSDLSKGVSIVQKAVPSKTTMSILECILIDASAGEIKMTANDMELGIETKIKGEIQEKGIIAIDAKIFSEIVRKLPDNDVTIETDASFQMKITCEKSRFTIAGKSGEDFSYLPFIEKIVCLITSRRENCEREMQSVFSIKGEYQQRKVIVPGKTLIEVSKILSGETEDIVNLFFTKNHIVFEFDETVVVSRLIEGEYFRIEQMLSTDYETKVKINKRELLSCIDRATLLIRENEKKPVIIQISDGEMLLKLTSGFGSMNEEIFIEKEGKDILIGFNPKFLIDALRVIDDEMVTLYLVNPKAPCFIRDEKESYIYLILPVNFNSASV